MIRVAGWVAGALLWAVALMLVLVVWLAVELGHWLGSS